MRNWTSDIPNDTETRVSAPAIARAARILDAVAAADGPIGLSEIARQAGLSKSSVHGLIAALTREGFLISVSAGKGYSLGSRLLELGSKVRDQRLLEIAESEIEQIARRSGETAFLGRLHGNDVIILARGDSARPLNLSAAVGSAVPLSAGALGKAYLASIGPGGARRFLERTVLPRYTDRSITDSHIYLEQVLEAAADGYATDRGEYLSGVSAVAAAFSWLGATFFVWAVAIDASYNDVELEQVGMIVRDAAEAILERLTQVEETPIRSAE